MCVEGKDRNVSKVTEKLKVYIRGWLDYFGIASMKITMQRWGEWLRRGLRKAYWNVPEVRC